MPFSGYSGRAKGDMTQGQERQIVQSGLFLDGFLLRFTRKAPMRCPVSCASTWATWNRQPTRRDACGSARHPWSATTTRTGSSQRAS